MYIKTSASALRHDFALPDALRKMRRGHLDKLGDRNGYIVSSGQEPSRAKEVQAERSSALMRS